MTHGRNLSIAAVDVAVGRIDTTHWGAAGGDIDLQASGNAVAGDLNTESISVVPFHVWAGGDVRMSAGGDLQVQNITTIGLNERSGLVALQAGGHLQTGNVAAGNDTSFFLPRVASNSISMTAGGDLRAGDLSSSLSIDLNAGGSIAAGNFDASTTDWNAGGRVTLQAGQDLRIGDLDTTTDWMAGDASLVAGRDIFTGNVATQSEVVSPWGSPVGGAIALQAGRNVRAGDLGNDGDLDQGAATGAIAINAAGSVSTGNLRTQTGYNLFSMPLPGADVRIAAGGDLTVQNVETGGDNEPGGRVDLQTGGSLTVGDITTGTAGVIVTPRSLASPVVLTANGNVQAGLVYGGSSATENVGIRIEAGGNLAAVALSTRRADWSEDSGDIVATVGGNLQVNFASTNNGLQDAGAIAIAAGGNLDIDTVSAVASTGSGSDARLQAGGDLRVGAVETHGSLQGGAIVLRSGRSLQFQTLDSSTSGFTPPSSQGGGDITIDSGAAFSATNLSISSDSSQGRGGTIRFYAPTLEFRNAQLTTEVFQAGVAGDILLQATEAIRLQDGSRLASTIAPTSSGQSGNIRLSAPQVALSGSSWLDTSTLGTGNTGNIQIDASNLAVTDSFILSATSGIGNAGQVTVHASGAVQLDNSFLSTAVGNGGSGQGGSVMLNAGSLAVRHGAQIQALTSGQGNAGNVQRNIAGLAEFAGSNDRGFLSGVYTSTDFPGFAGGNITVNAGELQLRDGAALSAQTFSSGNSGQITVNAGRVALSRGGQILTSARGSGAVGDLRVQAGDRLDLSGSDANFANRPTPPPLLRSNVPTVAPATSLLLAGNTNHALETTLDLNAAFSIAPSGDPNPFVGNSTTTPYVSVQGDLSDGNTNYYRIDAARSQSGVATLSTFCREVVIGLSNRLFTLGTVSSGTRHLNLLLQS